MPFEQHPLTATSLAIVARTAGDPMTLANAFREIIRTINGDVPGARETMNDALSISVATPRFRTLLIGVVRGAGAGPGDRRRLRRDGVRGQPADGGDRRAHGDGRRVRRHPQAGDGAGPAARASRASRSAARSPMVWRTCCAGCCSPSRRPIRVVFLAVPLALLATAAAADCRSRRCRPPGSTRWRPFGRTESSTAEISRLPCYRER